MTMYGPDEIADDMAEPSTLSQEAIRALIQLADDVSRWPWDPEGIPAAQEAADATLELIPPDMLAAVRRGI